MKKLCLLAVCFGVVFAEMIIPATNLPKKAQTFIANHLKGENVMYAEMAYDSYDVIMSNGTRIEFLESGEWQQVKCYNGINPAILPAPVAGAVAKKFPNVKIIKIHKQWDGYEIKLSNRIEAYFDTKGNLRGQRNVD